MKIPQSCAPQWTGEDKVIQLRTSINTGAQRGPNTDPGLPGETGVSGDCGTMYGIDGLKCG
jgi:hypothetical protein